MVRVIWRGQQEYIGDISLQPGIPKDIPDEIAERLEKDFGRFGLIEIVKEDKAGARALDAPPGDRMVRKAPKKRGRKK